MRSSNDATVCKDSAAHTQSSLASWPYSWCRFWPSGSLTPLSLSRATSPPLAAPPYSHSACGCTTACTTRSVRACSSVHGLLLLWFTCPIYFRVAGMYNAHRLAYICITAISFYFGQEFTEMGKAMDSTWIASALLLGELVGY